MRRFDTGARREDLGKVRRVILEPEVPARIDQQHRRYRVRKARDGVSAWFGLVRARSEGDDGEGAEPFRKRPSE